MTILQLIFAVLYVEAVTEIFVASSLFHGLRDRISQRGGLLAEFVHCGYCVSVWVSVTVAWALPRLILDHPVDFGFRVFIVHRLANVTHELWSRWFGRMPWMLVLNQPQQNPRILEPPLEAQPTTTSEAPDNQQPS